ncbi:MAG: hypothetical protein QXE66_03775, partial [Desulfurococcaceae archaeon]
CYGRGEDLGVLVRNYEVTAYNGYLLIKSVGISEIGIECKKHIDLEKFVKVEEKMDRPKAPILIDWYTLRNLFQCYPVVYYENTGKPEKLKHLCIELEDQVFLIPSTTNDELSEYIYRVGRGLRIKLNKGSITLLYL